MLVILICECQNISNLMYIVNFSPYVYALNVK